MKPDLTIELLRQESHDFSQTESQHNEPSLFGVTDGKAVGTYLEHKFQAYLHTKYTQYRKSHTGNLSGGNWNHRSFNF